jgi:hypothetical protein
MARMAESRMMLHDTLYTLSASSTLAAMPVCGAGVAGLG